MMKQIETRNAPEALGPYSQAVVANGWIYISGQLGIDPTTSELAESFDEEARFVFANIAAILAEAGSDFSKLVKLTIYLTDLGHFGQVNLLMSELFSAPYPARATVEVAGLPKGAQIEIDAVGLI